MCVQEDGAVLLYDMFGNYQHTFNMGQVGKGNVAWWVGYYKK